jgi:quercetin dioxygenase-like cupin family protein
MLVPTSAPTEVSQSSAHDNAGKSANSVIEDMGELKMKTLAAAVALSLLMSGAATMATAQSAPTGPVGLKLTPILETATTITGQPIRFPQGDSQFTAVLAEVAPGGQVGRHMHPVPLFVYMLEGTLSIEMDGHGTHTFSAGQGFAEVTNLWHNGRNLTDKPVRFLIVFSGQKGTPNLIRP